MVTDEFNIITPSLTLNYHAQGFDTSVRRLRCGQEPVWVVALIDPAVSARVVFDNASRQMHFARFGVEHTSKKMKLDQVGPFSGAQKGRYIRD